MRSLLVATTNAGKLAEIRRILPTETRLVTLADLADSTEVVEDGESFRANAEKKALTFARRTGMVTLADDSGLEVDALGGAPGVRSARFAGENATDGENNEELLRRLLGVPERKRTSRFRCVLAVATPDGEVRFAEGRCEGTILERPQGSGGYGYDPVFYVPDLGATFAEITADQRDRISHRGEALRAAREIIGAAIARATPSSGPGRQANQAPIRHGDEIGTA